MAGPDPAVAAVRLAVRAGLRGVEAGGVVTVACSGGADSVALAAAVAVEAPRAGLPMAAVTVDHGLAPGSADRAAAVVRLLTDLGFVSVESWAVTVGVAGGPEAAARDARYEALSGVVHRSGGWVALGHTVDDQAETVLLGLGRGSGARSLAGMDGCRRPWLRPLLGVRRATTRLACRAEGLPVWDDPHNDDPRYTRVRLRHEVLPLLEEVLGGGVAAALARTADQLRSDTEAFDHVVADLARQRLTDRSPPVGAFDGLPVGLRTRLVRHWLAPDVPAPTAAHLAAIDALVTHWRGQGRVALPGGWVVLRSSGRLHLLARSAAPPPPLDERREP